MDAWITTYPEHLPDDLWAFIFRDLIADQLVPVALKNLGSVGVVCCNFRQISDQLFWKHFSRPHQTPFFLRKFQEKIDTIQPPLLHSLAVLGISISSFVNLTDLDIRNETRWYGLKKKTMSQKMYELFFSVSSFFLSFFSVFFFLCFFFCSLCFFPFPFPSLFPFSFQF